MRARIAMTFVAGGLVATIATLLIAAAPAPQRASWEYKRVGGYPDDSKLNDWGADGWELVAVTYPDVNHGTSLYFKRPKLP